MSGDFQLRHEERSRPASRISGEGTALAVSVNRTWHEQVVTREWPPKSPSCGCAPAPGLVSWQRPALGHWVTRHTRQLRPGRQCDGLESSNTTLQHSPSSPRTPAPRYGYYRTRQPVRALQPSAGAVERPLEDPSCSSGATCSLRWHPGYASIIRFQCIQFKLLGREPEDLASDFDERLRSLAEAGGCGLSHIYVRRGCIELTLDLERGSEGSRLEDAMADNDECVDSGSEYSARGTGGGSRSGLGAGAGSRGAGGAHVVASGGASGAGTEDSDAGHLVPGRVDLGTPEAAPSVTQIVFCVADPSTDAMTAAASTGSSLTFAPPSTVAASPEQTGSLPSALLWPEAEPEPAERRNAPPRGSSVHGAAPFGGASPGAGDGVGAGAGGGATGSCAHGGGGGGASAGGSRSFSEAGHRGAAGVSAVAFAQACFAPQAKAPAITHLHPRVVRLLWGSAGSAAPSMSSQRQPHQPNPQQQQQQPQGSAPMGRSDCGGDSGIGSGSGAAAAATATSHGGEEAAGRGGRTLGANDPPFTPSPPANAPVEMPAAGGPVVERAHGAGPAVERAHGAGPAVERAHGAGPAVERAHGAGPAVERAHGAGPAVERAHGAGPAAALTLRVRIAVPTSGPPSEPLTRVHASRSAPAGGGLPGGSAPSWGPPVLPPDLHEPPPLELLLRCAGRYIPCDITDAATTAAAASETAAGAAGVDAAVAAAMVDVGLFSARDDRAPAGASAAVANANAAPAVGSGSGNAASDVDNTVSYDYAVTLLEPPPVSCGVLLVDLRWRGRPCHVAPLLLVDDPCVAAELSEVASTWTGPPHELDGLLYDMGAWVKCMAARRVAGAAAAARPAPWAAAGNALHAVSVVAAAGAAGPGVVGPGPLCLPVLGASLLQFAHGQGLLRMAARLQMDMRLCGYTAPFRPLLRNWGPAAAVPQPPQHSAALLPRVAQPSSPLGIVAPQRPAAAPAAHGAEALHRLCAEEAPAPRSAAHGLASPAAAAPPPRPAGAWAASLAPVTASCRPCAGGRQDEEPANGAPASQGHGTHRQAAAAVQAVPPRFQLVERGLRGPGRRPYGDPWAQPWRRVVAAVKATLRRRPSIAEEESYQEFAESYCTTVSCLFQLIDLLSLLELLLRLFPVAFGAGGAAAEQAAEQQQQATRAPGSPVALLIVMTSLPAAANGLAWLILPPRAWRRAARCAKLVRHCCLTAGRLVSMSAFVAHAGLQGYGPGPAALVMEAVIMPAACLLSPASAMLLAALKLPLYVAVGHGAALSATPAAARASIAAAGSGAPTGPLELVVSNHGTGVAGVALADVFRAVVLTVGPLLTTLACHVYLRLQFQRQQEATRHRGNAAK